MTKENFDRIDRMIEAERGYISPMENIRSLITVWYELDLLTKEEAGNLHITCMDILNDMYEDRIGYDGTE